MTLEILATVVHSDPRVAYEITPISLGRVPLWKLGIHG